MDGQVASYDLVIRNALLFDGSGAEPVRGDLAVEGGLIAAVGKVEGRGRQERDGDGLAVSPGFIDVHTHDDRLVRDAPAMTPKLSQGVTSVITGNCGISLAPLQRADEPPPPLTLLGGTGDFRHASVADYRQAVTAARPAVNVGMLIGHSTLRVAAMTDVYRPATSEEQAQMVTLLAEGMAAGALGFSSGVYYKTGAAADLAELVMLAKVAAEAGGVYTSHIRSEFADVLEALGEACDTGLFAGLPVVISHHKCAGPDNWGRTLETLPYLTGRRAKQPVVQDAYPYVAGSTVLDPDMVDPRIRIMVAWSKSHPQMAGRDLADIAADWAVSQREAAERLQPAGAVYFQMDEADVRRVLADPFTMIGSDGLPHDAHPHPRLWGTFPRVLGHYARQEGLFTQAEAIRRMTALAADTFGLGDRGRLKTGLAADLVLFDPDRIIDRATFEAPLQVSDGIASVYVNGIESWRDGAETGLRGGRVLDRRRRAA